MIADMVEQGIFDRGRPPDLYTFIPDLNHVRRFEMLGAMLSAREHSDAPHRQGAGRQLRAGDA